MGEGDIDCPDLVFICYPQSPFSLTKVPILMYWSKGRARSILCGQDGVSCAVFLPLLSRLLHRVREYGNRQMLTGRFGVSFIILLNRSGRLASLELTTESLIRWI